MRKLSLFLLLGAFVFAATACSNGNPEKVAKDACSCVKSAGLSSAAEILAMEDNYKVRRKVQGKMRDCMEDVVDKIRKDMKELDNSEDRAQYIKDLLNTFLDTDCADMALEALPYEEMMRELPGGSKNRGSSGFGGVDICDCVNMGKSGEPDRDLERACKKLAQEYDDDDRKEELREAIKECEEFN